jgi:hypothetical protein
MMPMAPTPCPTQICIAEHVRIETKWSIQTVTDKTGLKLEICQGDDCKVSCDKFAMTIGECALKVTVVDKQVHVECPCLTASADTIKRGITKDQLVLEGNVNVQSHKTGVTGSVTRCVVIVDLAEGSLKVKPTGDDEVKTFKNWNNFFR